MSKVSDEVFTTAAKFVASKLGYLNRPPKLLELEELEDTAEPWEPAAVLAHGWEDTVEYSSKVMPERRDMQLTILLHELSEMRYNELSEESPHDMADQFVWDYGPQVGAATRPEVDIELIKKGYFYSFLYAPEHIFRRAMRKLLLPLPPSLEKLIEERKKRLREK